MLGLLLKAGVMLLAFFLDPEERERRRKEAAEDEYKETMERATEAVGDLDPDGLFFDLEECLGRS